MTGAERPDAVGPVRAARAVPWALLAAATFLSRLAMAPLVGVGPHDETWFHQVVSRVAGGETLHRDVFFGSTPLAVQISALAASVLGTHAFVFRAVCAAAATTSALAALRMLLLCGVRVPLAVALLALPFVPLPDGDQVYGTLALALLLVAAGEALVASGGAEGDFDEARRRRASWLAGAACGLAFASKPNVGASAGTAALLTIALSAGPRHAARCLGGALVAGAAPLLPILFSGAGAEFLDQVFTNKVTYLERAPLPPWRALGQALGLARREMSTWPGTTMALLAAVAPALATGTLALALVRERGATRRRLVAVAAFTAAGFVFLFPRTDLVHVRAVLPVAVVGAAIGLRALLPSAACAVVVAILGLVWALPAWFQHVAAPLLSWRQGGSVVSKLPGYEGTLVRPEFERQADEVRRALAVDAAQGPTLVVSGDAGFWYRVAGIRNPTPFDYAFVTAFGRDGERRTVDDVESGRIRTVYLAENPDVLRARDLESAVQRRLRAAERIGHFQVWR